MDSSSGYKRSPLDPDLESRIPGAYHQAIVIQFAPKGSERSTHVTHTHTVMCLSTHLTASMLKKVLPRTELSTLHTQTNGLAPR
eukprot:6193540-Pleurochrysis_carterae.AAC.2